MATLTATRRDEAIRAFHERPIGRGKLPWVAPIACMRKLPTILDAMLGSGTRRDDFPHRNA